MKEKVYNDQKVPTKVITGLQMERTGEVDTKTVTQNMSEKKVVETSEKYNKDEKGSYRKRIIKNVIVIGVVSTLFSTIKDAMTNIQSSVNPDHGLGTVGLISMYVGAIISNTFLSAAVVRWLGTRKTLIGMMLLSVPCIIAQYHASFYTLVPTAALAGLSAGPSNIVFNSYISVTAEAYAMSSGTPSDVIVPRFYGILLLMAQTSEIWGNLVSSMVLSGDSNAVRELQNRTDCGMSFCPRSSELDGTPFKRPTEETLLEFVIVLCCISAAVIFLVLLGVDSLTRYRESGCENKEEKTTGCRLLAVTLKYLYQENTQKLLLIISVWLGIEQAFMSADFTAAYVTCSLGVHHVGYALVPYGITNALSSFLTGWIVKLTGRIPMMCAAFALHFAITVLLLTWVPDPNNSLAIFYIVPALWGLGNGVIIVLNLSLYGLLHQGEEEASFSNHELWLAMGFILGYCYNAILCTYIKIYIMLATLVMAFGAYLCVEYIHCKKFKCSHDFTT